MSGSPGSDVALGRRDVARGQLRPAAPARPRVVLMCHETDAIDSRGLRAWLASSMDLVGVVNIRGDRAGTLRRIRNELRRVGPLGFLDVLAFRVFYRVAWAASDAEWIRAQVERLRAKYSAAGDGVPEITVPDPNTRAVQSFLRDLRPDLMIARCKFILRPDVFHIPTFGTFALHPGICPEYRNAHGCFWALVGGDRARVGMTLLRIDRGVDTGAVFLHGSYAFDERRESHVAIQYGVVIENLDAIAATLRDVCSGKASPISTKGRASAAWGQPRLSAYLRWRRRRPAGAR